MKLYIVGAAIAISLSLMGTSYLKGRSDGKSYQKSVAQRELEKLNIQFKELDEAARSRELKRLETIVELENSIEELKGKANEDPNADNISLGIDSVRRINSIR